MKSKYNCWHACVSFNFLCFCRLVDIKFFSLELIITLTSCTLYHTPPIDHPTHDHIVTEDMFMHYLTYTYSYELQHLETTPFLECHAVKLIKGLLQCAVGGIVRYGNHIHPVHSMSTPGVSSVPVSSARASSDGSGGFLRNLHFQLLTRQAGFDDTPFPIAQSVKKFFVGKSLLHSADVYFAS
jgi:hypothetical protein